MASQKTSSVIFTTTPISEVIWNFFSSHLLQVWSVMTLWKVSSVVPAPADMLVTVRDAKSAVAVTTIRVHLVSRADGRLEEKCEECWNNVFCGPTADCTSLWNWNRIWGINVYWLCTLLVKWQLSPVQLIVSFIFSVLINVVQGLKYSGKFCSTDDTI